MSRTSAYKTRIRTGSADAEGFILLAGGELVAVLVELSDESHGDERGKWAVEATFGLPGQRVATLFESASEAAHWVGLHICDHPFVLDHEAVHLN